MINYKKCLEQQQKELMKLEKIAAENLKAYKGLEKGNIRVSTCNGCAQYRFRKEGEEKEIYLPAYDYEENGLTIGENLIISIETHDRPLDVRAVRKKAKKIYR